MHFVGEGARPFGLFPFFSRASKIGIEQETTAMKMRAGWYERCGPADEVIEVGEMECAEPGPGEVLVRLYASGIDPSDYKRRGNAKQKIEFPRVVPHSDGAGIVAGLGAGVSGLQAGRPRLRVQRPMAASVRHGGRIYRAARLPGPALAGDAEFRRRGLPRHSGDDRLSCRLQGRPGCRADDLCAGGDRPRRRLCGAIRQMGRRPRHRQRRRRREDEDRRRARRRHAPSTAPATTLPSACSKRRAASASTA